MNQDEDAREQTSSETRAVDRYLAFAFGVVFLIVLLYAGLRTQPIIDPPQFFILRVIVAIAAAGVAATIPGFLSLKFSAGGVAAVRAGGAIAVFVAIYQLNPPVVITADISTSSSSEPHTISTSPIAPTMVKVKGGCFMMGSNSEDDSRRDPDEIEHKVCVKDFLIGENEVTFDEYDRFAAATGKAHPSDEGWGRQNTPVINVSLRDAKAYAQWLSKELGTTYRLPTEAEWEYAARGKSQHAYWWGTKPSHDEANYFGKEGRDRWDYLAPVGSFDANPFGLHDTAGNVWEWTCSAYSRKYDGSELKCANEDYYGDIVLRGGSWQSREKQIRNSYRARNTPETRRYFFGFRLAATLPEQQ